MLNSAAYSKHTGSVDERSQRGELGYGRDRLVLTQKTNINGEMMLLINTG
jgi:hypothetical protein